MFRKLYQLRLSRHVPNSNGFIVGKSDNLFTVRHEIATVCCVFVTCKRSQQRFVAQGKKPHLAVIATDTHQLTVGTEFCSVCGFPEFGQTFEDVIGKGVENLNLKCKRSLLIQTNEI